MVKINKKIILNKTQQLIDLNDNMVNFDIKFVIRGKDSHKQFFVSTVSQEQLDNDYDITFEESEQGVITGSLINTNDIHDNYYLLLKSSEDDVEVDIVIDINRAELPVSKHIKFDNSHVNEDDTFMKKYGFIIFIVIVCLCFAVYYFMYIHNKSIGTENEPVISQCKLNVDLEPQDCTKMNTPRSLPPSPPRSLPPSPSHIGSASETSSPVSEHSVVTNVSEGCKKAISELMSKCVDL